MFFNAPPTIPTRIFARLPDSLRRTGHETEWHRGQPGVHPEHSLLEGPAFDRDGMLWCVDIPYGRIFRVSPTGTFSTVVEYDGEPNGLAIHRDGRIFIADYANGIMVLDPSTGQVTPFITRVRLERLKAVNDLVFASNGDLYFTDQGLTGLHDPTGRVFRVRADGHVDCLLDNIPSPNGIALDPTETTLYVAVTRANSVWRVPLLADGGVAKVGNFIQLSGGGGPDGLAVDSEGNLAVAHIGLGVIWLFSARGEPMARIQSTIGHHTTNMAYGGPDGRTLFITESESGTLLQADMPVPGLKLFSHQ
ncbi:MAG TPA: gluconolactonase [Polaromonas sp.]|uniref:SMP-30/gluconolactonase/LRE family protein n=1 Tax=Polaromonas sp. UBA4122 TaxID=1947074 RepID=UPI000EEBE419|nr:SMP-30/gluconolactonase/LRE family protein [Polaromonas sp. UBA4122]HAL37562.1 gluconolactonase [Polaromonas sp.]